MEISNKLKLIKAILETEINITPNDYINLEDKKFIINLINTYGKTKVFNFFKSITDKDHKHIKFKVENNCKICGKLFVDKITKTDIKDLILNNSLCDDCSEAKRKEVEKYLNESSKIEAQRRTIQKEIDDKRNEDYIKNMLNPYAIFKKETDYKTRWEIVNDYSIDRKLIKKEVLKLNYYDFLKTPYWKTVSMRAKYKADYKCILCSSNKDLETHHPNYDILGDELNNMDKLVVLCHNCHDKHHKK